MTDTETITKPKKSLGKKKDHDNTTSFQEVEMEFVSIPFDGVIKDFTALGTFLIENYYLDGLLFIDYDRSPLTPTITSCNQDGTIQYLPKVCILRDNASIQLDDIEVINLAEMDDFKTPSGTSYHISFFSKEGKAYDYFSSFYIVGTRFRPETISRYNQQYKKELGLKSESSSSPNEVQIFITFRHKVDTPPVTVTNDKKPIHISCYQNRGTDLIDYLLYTASYTTNVPAYRLYSPDLTLVIEGDQATLEACRVEQGGIPVKPVFEEKPKSPEQPTYGTISLRAYGDPIRVKPEKGIDITCRWMAPNEAGKMSTFVTHQVHLTPAITPGG